MAKTTLADLITEPALEEVAGDRSFARGVEYFRSGAVERLVFRDGRISARVVGTDVYSVKLWPEGRRLEWDCTCPMGADGEFCKHLVATGLAWLARGNVPDEQAPAELQAIRAFLEGSDKQVLVEMLVERAIDDGDLAAELLLAAQRQGVPTAAGIEETIRKAFSFRDFVDYHAMPRFAAGARPIPEMLRELLKQGDTKAVIELSSKAAKHGLKLLENCDDSDGLLGDILSEIAATHLDAVRAKALAPSELAGNLIELQLADGFGFFELENYLPALGKEGLAAYRRLAEAAWKKVPQLTPGTDEDPCDDWRYQISEIMKTLARMDNDTDALVDVLKRDLTEPYTCLEIAEALAKAKRYDEALNWAEQGRRASKGQPNIPLDDFLVKEYHRRKRHDDAVALRWSRFLEHPSLHGYQQLKASSEHSKNWNVWREKALTRLRKPETGKSQSRPVFLFAEAGDSVLIQILLWEGDPAAALAQARAGGCPTHLWLEIARALEADNPTDAITIYRDQIDPIVRLTNNDAYDQAADLLRRMRDLMARTGKQADFAPYLHALRKQHKAKRNFMQRLHGISVVPSSGTRGRG